MEGLRMRPGTVGGLTKVVPPEGELETVDGKDYFLPGGTLIAANVPAVLRDTEVFGADAAVFRPERWLEADTEAGTEKRTEMVASVEMMFGTGRWMCAGKPIAYMELYKAFFEVCARPLAHPNFELCVFVMDRLVLIMALLTAGGVAV